MTAQSPDEFVSEPIEPIAGTADAAGMSRGEPGLPRRFRWRGREYEIIDVQQTWKTSSPSAGELYLRRHWYKVRLASEEVMTLYCERQAKNRNRPQRRWWLYTIGTTASPLRASTDPGAQR